jgi:asparaginyl-tRNA synthetase
MNSTPVKALLAGDIAVGENVTILGWVRSKRDSKAGISFVAVHDGSCFDPIQAVVPEELANYQDEVLHITTGCALEVSGLLVESQGKGQQFEIQATAVSVIGWVDEPETYPIAKKRHTFEYLRSVAHLRPRTNTFGAITRVRTVLSNAIHNYFFQRGFHWINTPLITASDCEGAGELFRVSTLDLMNLPVNNGEVDFSEDFFGAESFLTVSGQLNVEAYCLAMSKVYTFGPTFRAENSNTSRHLAEFWMVEPEIAFADLNDNADLAEDLLTHVLSEVLNNCEEDMAFFEQRIEKTAIDRLRSIIDNRFERMEYSEAVDILKKSGRSFEFPVEWGLDLQSEHERFLTEEHVGRPVVVMNYPAEIKAFYMRLNDDREERLDVLDARIHDEVMKEELWWYRDLRRYGTVPHAGFGLGFERLLTYITGMENIRDVIPFPRAPGSAAF